MARLYSDGQVCISPPTSCLDVDFSRIAAMTFGRPMRISQEMAARAPLPNAIDDEYLAVSGVQPQGQPSKLNFFITYCKLHEILADILSNFYTNSVTQDSTSGVAHFSTRSGTRTIDNLLRIDRGMTEWYNGLEPYLQMSSEYSDSEDALTFKRQGVILYAR
jgi:hypothetical protein